MITVGIPNIKEDTFRNESVSDMLHYIKKKNESNTQLTVVLTSLNWKDSDAEFVRWVSSARLAPHRRKQCALDDGHGWNVVEDCYYHCY